MYKFYHNQCGENSIFIMFLLSSNWCRPLFSSAFSVNKILFFVTFALGITFAVIMNYMSDYFRTKEHSLPAYNKMQNKVFSPIPYDFHFGDEITDSPILDVTIRRSDVEKSSKFWIVGFLPVGFYECRF